MIVVVIIVAVVITIFLLTVLRGAPYVPSRRTDLELAFTELIALGANDLLVDIGSGDGVVLRQAVKNGARAIGYEINPILVLVSKWLCRHDNQIEIKFADYWLVDLPPETTVVYTFGEGRDIEKMGQWVARQVDKQERMIYFLSYGFELKSRQYYKKTGVHFLYKIEPLQNIAS